jgi:hypothetical protein
VRERLRAAPRRQYEPAAPVTHFGHVMREMEWLATDVMEERRWKLALCRKLAREAVREVHKREARLRKAAREAEAQVGSVRFCSVLRYYAVVLSSPQPFTGFSLSLLRSIH